MLLLGLGDRVFLAFVAGSLALLALAALLAFGVLALRWQGNRRAAAWAATERRLEPLILRALSGDASADEVWEAVQPGEESATVRYLLERFARNLKGAELDRVREIALPLLDTVAADAASHDPEVRARAIQILAVLGLEKYEGLIVRALSDRSPGVALVCVRALARRGDARHASAILANLHRLSLWSPSFLSGMLASMGPEAVPLLAERYADPKEPPEVRAICADALRQIGVPAVADVAAEVLARLAETSAPIGQRAADGGPGAAVLPGREVTRVGEEREVILQSLRLLGEWGHAAHLPLLRTFARSPDPVIRSLGVAALGHAGGPADVPLLSAAIEDPSRWVAMHAAIGLRDLGALGELSRFADGSSERASLASEVMLG